MNPDGAHPLAQQGGTADAAYGAEWRALEDDPGPLVFLLGCQRSGTTWLHLQLARSGAFRWLSAYDVAAADRLVHEHRQGRAEAGRAAFEAQLQAADRGIDAIPAQADTPEEYGLVTGDGGLRYERPDTTAATLPRLRELLAKKALIEGRGRPLLLKSPPDYPDALPLLAASWPQARFIAIQRHPLPTLQSQVNAWRQLALRPNAYLLRIDRAYRDWFADTPRRLRHGLFLHSPAGVAWLADSILRAHLGFLRWLDTRADVLTLRYEDLCADQAAGFARIGRHLGLALPSPAQAPLPRESRLLPEVQAAFDARRASFAPFLQRFGYDDTP